MKKQVVAAAAAMVAMAAAPAMAAVTVKAESGVFAPRGSSNPYTLFDFNSGNEGIELANLAAAGFGVSTTGTVGLRLSSQPNGWTIPAPGDASPFVSVQENSALTILANASNPNATRGYDEISFYLGSVDSYNFVDILGLDGQIIQSFSGSQLIAPATPNGSSSYRVTFSGTAGERFGGLTIRSTTANAAEFDNLVFAVPEPSTWALMLAGFGMVGMAMRTRRRRTSVVFG